MGQIGPEVQDTVDTVHADQGQTRNKRPEEAFSFASERMPRLGLLTFEVSAERREHCAATYVTHRPKA